MKRINRTFLILLLALGACHINPAPVGAGDYPVHRNITVTIFWIGEEESPDNDYIDNIGSAWDSHWMKSYGGFDDPDNRDGYHPARFTPKENPFYFALPFNDFGEQGRKAISYSVVPWANREAPWRDDESMLKNRWIKITKGKKSAYAQWQDVGPFESDDHAYVFGRARPATEINHNVGLDVSPAVTDYLRLRDIDVVDWQFVDSEDVPDGPWKSIITTSQINWN